MWRVGKSTPTTSTKTYRKRGVRPPLKTCNPLIRLNISRSRLFALRRVRPEARAPVCQSPVRAGARLCVLMRACAIRRWLPVDTGGYRWIPVDTGGCRCLASASQCLASARLWSRSPTSHGVLRIIPIMLNSYSRKSLMRKTIVGGANARTGYPQRRPQATGSGCGLASHFGVSQAHHAPQARGRLAQARARTGWGRRTAPPWWRARPVGGR